jgi:hypothetical protein
MKLKNLLKHTGVGFLALAVLMIVTALLISKAGGWVAGGGDKFSAWLASAAIPLLVLRICFYAIIAFIGFKAWKIYKLKEDTAGMSRIKRTMICFAFIVAFIELPSLL